MNTTHDKADGASIYALAYISRRTRVWSADEALLLQPQCTLHNRKAQITGRLLYCKGLFLQLLEGPAQELVELMGRISSDIRHERVTSLFFIASERHHEDFGLRVESTSRSEFMQYARHCMMSIAHLSDAQAQTTLNAALDYMAADHYSLPTVALNVRRMQGVKVYFRDESEIARKSTNFNILQEVQTVPLRLGSHLV
jgi:hypothetical protein